MTTDLKSPQQQIYDAVFLASHRLGYRTYPYLPAKDAALPFVYIGEQFDQDRRTKSIIYGDVQQTIHIYHLIENRRDLTDMMNRLKEEIRKIKRTENFYVRSKRITAQTLQDTSTPQPLWHGVIEAEFTFN